MGKRECVVVKQNLEALNVDKEIDPKRNDEEREKVVGETTRAKWQCLLVVWLETIGKQKSEACADR